MLVMSQEKNKVLLALETNLSALRQAKLNST